MIFHGSERRTATALLMLLAACGSGEPSAETPDAAMGPDGAADARPPDSAGPDTGTGPEVGSDAGGDAGTDAGSDAASNDGPSADGDSGPLPTTGIFAAPDGSGTACTLAAPCTLQGAAAAVRAMTAPFVADVIVWLRGGTYRLTSPFALGPQDSGSGGHQVVYRAYPGETPSLVGSIQVTSFALHDAARNIWRAPVPAGTAGRQLFVDGVRAQRARTLVALPAVTVTATGFATTDATYASFANQSAMEIAQNNNWKHMRCPLASVSSVAAGGSSFNVVPSCWTGNAQSVPNVGFPFNGAGLPALSGITWVENAYELLSQPGQFYLDSAAGYVYYIPRAGEALASADVELPTLESLVLVSGTPAHLAPLNDSDPGATYSGSWSVLGNRGLGDLDNDVHATSTLGDSVTYTFTGTGLEVLGETNTDEAPFAATVDGQPDTRQAFTQVGPSRAAQVVVYSIQGLAPGMHSVKLANAQAGAWTVIDGFVVVSDAVAPAHDIAFEGVTFAYSTWMLPTTTGYIDNQAGVLWNASTVPATPIRIPAAVAVHRGKNVSFHGDSFVHLGGAGVDLADGTQDSSIVGCVVQDTSGGGVSVGEVDDYFQTESSLMTSGDVVSDNAISFVGMDYHDAVGIWVGYTRTLTVAHNDIGHTPYSGMSLGWGWGWASPCTMQAAQGLTACTTGPIYAGGNQIVGNYIHDVMNVLNDGGAIYTNGGQGDGNGSATSVVTENFVTGGNHTSYMLYHDEGSSYWRTHDNVTSLGGADWIGMWTPTIHDNTIGPTNFTDNAAVTNNGTNITFAQATVVGGGAWPAPALAIMSTAGLEPSYRPATANPTLDDDDQSIAYTGTWATAGWRGYGDFDDNVHYTTINGDSATVTFTGTGIALVGEKAGDQGMVEVFVDGQSQGMVDTSLPAAAARQVQQVLFTSAALPLASHTLGVVKRSGQYMTIDAVRIQTM
jgi:hypothetical protein